MGFVSALEEVSYIPFRVEKGEIVDSFCSLFPLIVVLRTEHANCSYINLYARARGKRGIALCL